MYNIEFLKHISYSIRKDSIISTTQAGSGHPTSALSCADIIAALFFYVMHFDISDFHNPDNDRFILSKGHASPVLYSAYKELGLISEQELLSLRKFDSPLEGHPTPRFKYCDAATGSLGQGLSIGAGIAISAKIDERNFNTYVLLGDSEVAEGSVWEAAEIAAFYKLNNLIAILDCNRLGQAEQTMFGRHSEIYANKFEAFGWNTKIVDGHNVEEILKAFEWAKNNKDKPSIIIANTIKGYGIDSVADKNGYHGKAFTKEELPNVLNELQNKFPKAANYKSDFKYEPKKPVFIKPKDKTEQINLPAPNYEIGKQIATRKAWGEAVTAVGKYSKNTVVLDAEVKNSTYSEIFEKEFPKRFIECFVAEQNMVGMAVGLASRGKSAYAATFGAFFTRAYDQIRMAAIGRSNIHLTGSHSGVSIGEDGPSQMALEDIAMMRAISDSVVLYPCDAVSTYKLSQEIANSNTITYLRTTRMATPVIYSNDAEFKIGGCHILKESDNDIAVVIAAGVTVFEALAAYEDLKKENIYISVIDLYSVKPLDSSTILKLASKSQKNIIIVEDHYPQGGIGEAVITTLANNNFNFFHLSVNKLPRSGSPEQLMSYERIDSCAIISIIKNISKRHF